MGGGGIEYNSGIARVNLAMFGKILYILITYYLQQLTPKSKIPWIWSHPHTSNQS